MNNRILDDDEFLPSFQQLWKHLSKTENDYNDVADWWDEYVKPQVKSFCIGFSSYRKDKRNQTKQLLLNSLKSMMEQSNWEEVIRIRDLINSLLVEDLIGVYNHLSSQLVLGLKTDSSGFGLTKDKVHLNKTESFAVTGPGLAICLYWMLQ